MASIPADEFGPDLSIVIPVYNESESLPVLWSELLAVLRDNGWTAEVLFVDDGSTDGSADVIEAIAREDDRVHLVRLWQNAGLSAALALGLGRARGRIVVTLDSDLQNDPRDIPRLVARLAECDAVCGWRVRRNDSWLKRLSSRVGNRVRNLLLGDQVKDSACTLRAMHRRCAADLPVFDGFHRFVPGLLRSAGHQVVELPVAHRPRRFGSSHYGVRNRAWRGLQDALGVRWMQRRALRYEAMDEQPEIAGAFVEPRLRTLGSSAGPPPRRSVTKH